MAHLCSYGPPDSPINDKITTLLAKLGNTADEIAQSLEVKGITGCQSVSHSCPLAIYLQDELPPGYIDVCAEVTWFNSTEIGTRIINSTAVSKFIRNFDHKLYPNLIKDS